MTPDLPIFLQFRISRSPFDIFCDPDRQFSPSALRSTCADPPRSPIFLFAHDVPFPPPFPTLLSRPRQWLHKPEKISRLLFLFLFIPLSMSYLVMASLLFGGKSATYGRSPFVLFSQFGGLGQVSTSFFPFSPFLTPQICLRVLSAHFQAQPPP